MCLGINKENDIFKFGNISTNNNNDGVILSLTIDNKLSFDNNVKKIVVKQVKRLVLYQEYQTIQPQNNKKFFLKE